MARRTASVIGTAAAAAVAAVVLAAPAQAQPAQFDGATTLQVPGVVVGWPLTRGAAVFNPVVEHGHGAIHPTPSGYGYVFQWTNLSTGASGTITDADPDRAAVVTGPGQVVVTGTLNLSGLGDAFKTPSVGTFYVTP